MTFDPPKEPDVNDIYYSQLKTGPEKKNGAKRNRMIGGTGKYFNSG